MRENYRFASFKKGQVKLFKFCDQIKYIYYLFIYLFISP